MHRAWIAAACAVNCAILTPTVASATTYRMLIQSHPDSGGRCLNVPDRQVVAGMRLQMSDCNNSPAQIFIYDDQSEQLKIGNVCVDAWGGDPDDAVGFGACNDRANQQWKMVEIKDYYQIVGLNGLCIGKKGVGTPLSMQPCDPADVLELWALVEAPQ